MSFRTSNLFHQPEFSDVTTTFSGRGIRCHKLILCKNSEYFMKLSGPGSHFVESNQQTIELKDDDPDAVEDWLKYLYTKWHNTKRDDDWRHQLEVAKTAEKYLCPTLAELAFAKLSNRTSNASEPWEVFETAMHIRSHADALEKLAVADQLEENHLLALMKLPQFRQLIDQDKDLLWRHLDHFTSFADGLVKAEMGRCQGCKKIRLWKAEPENARRCNSGYAGCAKAPTYITFWARKYDEEALCLE